MSRPAIECRDAYRNAARELFGISQVEAEVYIRTAADDPGEWAPDALLVIYTEADCRKEGDEGMLPGLLDYYSNRGDERCAALDAAAGQGTFIERINAAVAAVWPA